MANQVYLEDIEQGAELPTLVKHPTTRQLVQYAGASGDFYEIHYDLEFAKSRGLPSVILQGALKSAFLGQIVTDWMGGQGTLRRLSVQYRDTDVPGAPIYGKGVVSAVSDKGGESLVECDLWLENGEGKKTTQGHAVVALPSRER